MPTFRSGQVLLLTVPYTDGTPGKKRPAVVLADTGDADVIVARVTSQPGDGEYDVTLADWRKAALLAPSVVRVNKMATLSKDMVERELGTLSPSDWVLISEKLRQLFAAVQTK